MTVSSSQILKTVKGREIPALGFGTWQLKGNECRRSVEIALDTGYRHIDTARMYKNEVEVGQGITDSPVSRDDLFITSKVWHEDLSAEGVRSAVESSLKDLRLDHLDLVLIHWPNPDFTLETAIETLAECRERGQLREFGVSNFPPSWLERALRAGPVFCNQVEYHPFLGQKKLVRMAQEHDLMLTAYSPLGQGEVTGHDELQSIGENHGKSAVQIALRWLIEQDHVFAIPRSSSAEHIKSNFDIFDFELSEEDTKTINRLPKNQRMIDPDFAPAWED